MLWPPALAPDVDVEAAAADADAAAFIAAFKPCADTNAATAAATAAAVPATTGAPIATAGLGGSAVTATAGRILTAATGPFERFAAATATACRGLIATASALASNLDDIGCFVGYCRRGVAAVAAPKGVAPDCATDSNVIPAAIAPNSLMVFRIAPSSSDSIINDSHRAGRAFDPYQFDERSVEVTK